MKAGDRVWWRTCGHDVPALYVCLVGTGRRHVIKVALIDKVVEMTVARVRPRIPVPPTPAVTPWPEEEDGPGVYRVFHSPD